MSRNWGKKKQKKIACKKRNKKKKKFGENSHNSINFTKKRSSHFWSYLFIAPKIRPYYCVVGEAEKKKRNCWMRLLMN